MDGYGGMGLMTIGQWMGRGTLVTTLVALLFSGCVMPKFSFPEKLDVALVSIEPEKLSLAQQVFRVRFRVTNASMEEIPIAALQASIVIEGFDFAHVTTQQPLTVRAKGQTEVDVSVRTTLVDSFPDLNKIFKRRKEPIHYHLSGAIQVDRPLTGNLPFQKSGTIDLGGKLEGRRD